MDMSDDRFVDDQIRMSVSDDVPPRSRAPLALSTGRLSVTAARAESRPWHDRARGWARPAAWWGLGATCAAVVVLVAVAGLVLRPQTSFAEVTTAVLAQPWVHVRTVATDQTGAKE